MINKYVIGGAGIVILLMAGTIWALMQSRDTLLEENANLTQAINQAKVTNEQNQTEIARLEADIRWRDQQAVIRDQREKDLSDQLAATESELKELVKDAPCSGPDYLWPDAVYERMRAGTVADPDRNKEEASTR
ncbi:DUF2570 family protein [Marinobacter sp. UBA2688]|jgi:DNA polymerase III alpha subunit|uniref:DUF2570 family protein n=1 Tax=Marinobacter sp. UBA2688 TaxID=1946816 RepID=UPI00257AEB99|nr:DUF2570 family protein [Marinobacter sp. UBA2688]|tara:strand:- start:4272 stop:4673 length:402 start_codon:yes stop_codon:yes gene_type:complete